MILLALIAVPALAAVGAYAHRAAEWRTPWLVLAALLHLALVALAWGSSAEPVFQGWRSG